jgi:dihydrofolate synthase/folylpolyglutamate synthase
VQDDFLESLKLIGSKPGLERLNSKLGLERIRFLLKKSGANWEDIPVVHIAGTNGKGSVVTFISEILSQSNYKVGSYISPHLIEIYERIKIGNKNIPPKDFDRILYELKSYCEEAEKIGDIGSPTFFEVLTAVSIIYFSEKKVDFIVSEVGLGGRLDATNILNGKAVAITNISLDHQEILGNSREEILTEKAGIIKKGSIVSSCVDLELAPLLEKICSEKDAPLKLFNRDFEVKEKIVSFEGSVFDYLSKENLFKDVEIRMIGRHQINNAACAISIAESLDSLGFEIKEESIRKGLENSTWPGRFQILSRTPMILVDVAHNEAGAKSLSETYNSLFTDSKTLLLVGISQDKDIDGIFEEFSKISKRIVLTTIPPRCANIDILEEKARKYFKEIKSFEDPLKAFDYCVSNLKKEDKLLITGSIYVAGYILKGRKLLGS